MNPLWAVPAIVLLLGMGAIFVVLRQAHQAAIDLHRGLVRFGEVRVALATVRDEAAVARDSFEGLRHR